MHGFGKTGAPKIRAKLPHNLVGVCWPYAVTCRSPAFGRRLSAQEAIASVDVGKVAVVDVRVEAGYAEPGTAGRLRRVLADGGGFRGHRMFGAVVLKIFRYGAVLVAALPAASAQAQAAPDHPPMVFYVAKGGPDACGTGCSEWIAAEGPIGIGSAARLRAFLSQPGRQSLPIFFESGGGSVDEAFKIGRMLRQKGLYSGVGRTRPETCANDNEKICIESKKSGKPLISELTGERARCSSTCVYAFVGAKGRKAWPSTRLGVHSTQLANFHPGGRVEMVDMSKATPEQKKKLQQLHSELRDYFREMGVEPRLADLIQSVPFQQIRYLTSDEIVDFGIARPAKQ